MYHAAVQELVTAGIWRGHFDGCGCGSIGSFGADIQLLPRLVDLFLLLHHGWVPVLLAQGGCKPAFEVASQQKSPCENKSCSLLGSICDLIILGGGGGCKISQRAVYRKMHRD